MSDRLEKVPVLSFTLNGKHASAPVPHEMTLLAAIRERFALTGTKWSCEKGECGTCTVLMDGRPVTSCLVLAHQAEGREVWTVEGLALTDAGRAVVAAFEKSGAVQCGYCTPGMVVSACHLIERKDAPTRDDIRLAVSGVLCRCTGYARIFDGIAEAAKLHAAAKNGSKRKSASNGGASAKPTKAAAGATNRRSRS